MSFQNAFGNAYRGSYNFLQVTPPKTYESGTYLQAIQQDLMTSVFISRIPKELDDNDMLELLNVRNKRMYLLRLHIMYINDTETITICGNVKNWKRVKNVDGSATHFGFCIFESALGVIRASRSIAPERPPGYEWNENDPKYPFIIRADVATKNYIRSHPEMLKTERDQPVLDKLKELFAPLNHDPTGQMALTLTGSNEEPNQEMDVDENEEKLEKEKAEKRELEKQQGFKERERRFEQQETARIRRFYVDMEADREHEEKRLKSKEFQELFYAEYDDDKEANKDDDEYYRDRDHWWSKRQGHRAREREFDARDRRMEQDEIEAALAKERALAEALKEKEMKELEEEQNAQSVPGTAIELEPEQTSQSDIQVSRIMTKEERMAAIKDLVAEIPYDREGLWNWNVKWYYMNQTIITKKLEPFLKKKVVEHIGDESNDLVAFILEKIASHGSIQSIFDELSPVLVEETEVFCLKLWRMVVYETESRARGL